MLLQNKQGTSDIEQLYSLVRMLWNIPRSMCVPDSVRAAGRGWRERRTACSRLIILKSNR